MLSPPMNAPTTSKIQAIEFKGPDSIDPISDDSGEVDGGQEVPREFVIASCDTPEVLEATEATLDDISPFVGALAEAVEDDPVGFVWNV